MVTGDWSRSLARCGDENTTQILDRDITSEDE